MTVYRKSPVANAWMKTQTLYDLASEHVNERNTLGSVPSPLIFELVQFPMPLRIFHEGQRGRPESFDILI